MMIHAHTTTEIRSSVAQADGAYKVYLAICADPAFAGRFRCTRDGVQYLDNQKMFEPDYAKVAVQLARDWQIVVSREDLKAGIMAASATIEPRLVYGTSVSTEYTDKVREFLCTASAIVSAVRHHHRCSGRLCRPRRVSRATTVD